MHENGWAVTAAKFEHVRNCPVPGQVYGGPRQVCTLRICPFCYTRWLIQLYNKISVACKKPDVFQLATYTLTIDDKELPATHIYGDDTGSGVASMANIFDLHKYARMRIRERLYADAYGSILLTTHIPRVFFPERPPLLGYMVVRHRCVGIVPYDAKFNVPTNGVFLVRPMLPRGKLLCWLARFFVYPASWLRGNATLTLDFLAAAKNQNMLVTTGMFRKRSQ